MAGCLIAPSHYLHQCWLNIKNDLWHSPENNFTRSAYNICSDIALLKLVSNFPGVNELIMFTSLCYAVHPKNYACDLCFFVVKYYSILPISFRVIPLLPEKISWWHHQMETFSALLAFCRGNSPVTGEFPPQKPLIQSFDVLFYLRLNKRLSQHSRHQWFEMPSRLLWRHCNVQSGPSASEASNLEGYG